MRQATRRGISVGGRKQLERAEVGEGVGDQSNVCLKVQQLKLTILYAN